MGAATEVKRHADAGRCDSAQAGLREHPAP